MLSIDSFLLSRRRLPELNTGEVERHHSIGLSLHAPHYIERKIVSVGAGKSGHRLVDHTQ
jgi:hypothetical protein